MSEETVSIQSDRAGIASAVLCMVHCLAVPVFYLTKDWFTALPTWWHQLDYLFLLISFWAVYHSAGHTKLRSIKASLWIFWVILSVSIIFEATLHWMAYVASAGLIATHFINIKRLRKYRTYNL